MEEPRFSDIISKILIDNGCTINKKAVTELTKLMLSREIELAEVQARRFNNNTTSLISNIKDELARVDE